MQPIQCAILAKNSHPQPAAEIPSKRYIANHEENAVLFAAQTTQLPACPERGEERWLSEVKKRADSGQFGRGARLCSELHGQTQKNALFPTFSQKLTFAQRIQSGFQKETRTACHAGRRRGPGSVFICTGCCLTCSEGSRRKVEHEVTVEPPRQGRFFVPHVFWSHHGLTEVAQGASRKPLGFPASSPPTMRRLEGLSPVAVNLLSWRLGWPRLSQSSLTFTANRK